jgi:hypothetical protein
LYQLEDLLNEKIKGKFYEEELQKTELKDYAIVEKVLQTKTVKVVKKYFVKYRGYSDKFNEFIDANQLEKLTKLMSKVILAIKINNFMNLKEKLSFQNFKIILTKVLFTFVAINLS